MTSVGTDGVEAPPSDGRLPYEKPAVVWEQALEANPSLMSGCAKQPGAGGPCDAVGPASS
ncbi:MAG TPA: hypothetical protein VGB87_08400 [Vicinamibacteria bacterium]